MVHRDIDVSRVHNHIRPKNLFNLVTIVKLQIKLLYACRPVSTAMIIYNLKHRNHHHIDLCMYIMVPCFSNHLLCCCCDRIISKNLIRKLSSLERVTCNRCRVPLALCCKTLSCL